ncbi:MAG: polyprenyl synthetase family protein [Bacteroidales bacterium]
MSISEQIHVIPKNDDIRRLLRHETRIFISENKIDPPADIDTLQVLAKKLLKQLSLNNQYLEFTMVLLGNGIWSDVVAAIPFKRRMLLLPQCLRDHNNCKGAFDELGLICAGCNNCRINQILEVAHDLGYTTLIAEGTPVAVKLVEEGTIDAVIGVGCMAVLKRSFKPVNQNAVPAIALPLLYDGCDSTSMDYEWLFEEIGHFRPDPEITPISVPLLRDRVKEYFSPHELAKFFPEANNTEKLALRMMEMGGQRMRPLLTLIAYESAGKGMSAEAGLTSENNEIKEFDRATINNVSSYIPVAGRNDSEGICETLAVIIECFHKASLIHDDIEDNSETRYGNPTLHVSEGVPVAINVGDYLIGKGYRLLAGLPFEPGVLVDCLRVVSESHLKLSEGQGADLTLHAKLSGYSPADIMQIYKFKTGEAVKVALLLGAIAGGSDQNDLTCLREFSEWFGIAYQIRDDLQEYRSEDESGNILNFPFMLTLLNEEPEAAKLIGGDFSRAENYHLIKEYLEEYKIAEKAEIYLRDCLSKCYSALDKLRNFRLRLSLYRITGKVFNKI